MLFKSYYREVCEYTGKKFKFFMPVDFIEGKDKTCYVKYRINSSDKMNGKYIIATIMDAAVTDVT